MGMRFYVTTPIYYVNSTPTLGHAYTTIAADILTRHHRQRGDETYFLTGVDEHADKVARVAAEQGLEPQEYADRIVGAWQELPRRLNAVNDFFIRTSDDGHKRFVQDFLQRIYDNGDVYQDVYAGWYCVGCEAFKTEAELVDGKCPDHGTEPEWLEEKNWFFRLSAYQDRLLQLYDERPDFVLPSYRYNEARSFIAGGLRDFSISRATQTWGVPIPWDPDQVAYVWADALVNYRSALSYAPGENLERFWPAVHLLAKDILRFHCVFWPALLLSAGEEPPKQLFVHGYLNFDNRKMSKSLGNVIDPLELVDVYGVDAVRFYAARATTFGQDGNVSVDDVRERYERELANDLGNLVSRTTAMIARYRDGARRADERGAAVGRRRAPRQARRRARPVRHHGRDRRDLARRSPPEPVRRGVGAVAAREGRSACGRAHGGALQPRRWADRDCRRGLALPAGERAAHPRGARPAFRRPFARADSARHCRRRRRDRAVAAALPAHRASGRRRVIDTHAHLDAAADPADVLVERARDAGVDADRLRRHERKRRGTRRSRSPSAMTASPRRSASTRTRPQTVTSPHCATCCNIRKR